MRSPGSALGPSMAEPMRRFLSLDGAEHFDLQTLNRLALGEISRAGEADDLLRRRVRSKALELVARVKQENDDPTVVAALLRDLALEWYRTSSSLSEWSAQANERWAGLFADSRIAGGKLHPWIVRRLVGVAYPSRADHRLPRVLLRRLARTEGGDRFLERTPPHLWAGEAAQALLDDLAAHARKDGGRQPLVHLSELAGRRSAETVNQALALLFESPERGPFVILHPNRYPDCEQLAIRAPVPGAVGPALSYQLVISRSTPAAPSAVAPEVSPHAALAEGLSHQSAPLEPEAPADVDENGLPVDPWRGSLSPEAWSALLGSLRTHKQHLPSPPKDFRQHEGYRTLRELLLTEPKARKLFLATKWRGRPAGLLLLARLLEDGALSPEVATDYEYLDSELSDLERGNAEHRPDPPEWTLSRGRAVREGDFHHGYRYRWTPAVLPAAP